MPRIRNIDRPRRLETHVPESLYSKVHLELFSELEGKVPHGAVANLIKTLFTEWLKSRGVNV